jgi:hypothetical protein
MFRGFWVISAVTVMSLCDLSGMAQCSSYARLNTWERGQFIEASYGRPRAPVAVTVQFLFELGCGAKVVAALKDLGANVEYADDASGYAMVKLPRVKLLDTLDIAGISYAYTRDQGFLYQQYPSANTLLSERKAERLPAITIPYPRVATTLLAGGPYFAAGEMGLSSLWRQYPRADGRGVRIADVDAGFDLLHPSLQQARDAHGSIVSKVADLETLTSPEEDGSWVLFGEPIRTKDRNLAAAGQSWSVPEDGIYRFGILTLGLVLGPENNSHAKKLSLSVGVLFSPERNLVWVDTDGDGSFRNERALGDYRATHDIAWFGAKEGEDDNRIPFGVKIEAARDAVYVRIGGDHGTLVAGPLAANTLTGGLFNGAAPSAQLVDVQFSTSTVLAAIVNMAARSDIDVINCSGGIGRIAFTGYSEEGYEDFAQRVLERAIAIYRKPIPCYSAAAGTIQVHDYAGPEMLRRNRQLAPPYLATVNSFVWDLPNGLVNTVLAPSANLDTESRYMPVEITWEDGKRHGYSDDRFEPPASSGYWIGSNPSPTIPVVSGILADLISEARREHIRYNAVRLNNAIFTGARLLDGFPVSMQGYGLINAANSWNQLAKMAKADDPANAELTWFSFARPEKGQDTGKTVEVQGFHADLPNVGEKLDGEIWITRHGGYAGGRRYTFSLRGSDGSYELLDHEASLERNKAVRVRFRTNGESGRNVVFLELRDARADVVMEDVPMSVRVPDAPEKVAPGVDKYESTVQPLRSEYRYVHVGGEVQAVSYVMRIPYTGPASSSMRSFPGERYRTMKTPDGEPVDAAHHVGPIEELRSLVANSEPGTEEIFWENRGRSEYATQYEGPAPDVPIHATLTVTKYAVAITKVQPQTLSVVNQFAEADGHVELYDAKVAISEVHGQGNHAMAEVERDVPANLAQWRIRVTSSTKSAHADAYLLNCTGKDGCTIISQQVITDKGAFLVVEKPQAGAWKIVVRSREQVDGDSVYRLSEAQLVPTQAGAAATNATYYSGEKWTVPLPNTTQYAAFRIAGTPGVESEKNGLLIAMTPLGVNSP